MPPTPDPSPPQAGGGEICTVLHAASAHALSFPRLTGRGLSLRSPAFLAKGTRGEAPSGAETERRLLWPRETCPRDRTSDRRSPPARVQAVPPVPARMLDPGQLKTPAREPARLTALHRGIYRHPGPRFRGERTRDGVAGKDLAAPPRRRAPGDYRPRWKPRPLRDTRAYRPGPVRRNGCPSRRFLSPAWRCSSRNGHPRRSGASRARRGGFPGDAPAVRLVKPPRRGTAPPPHHPHHRTMPRQGRRSDEDGGHQADGDKFPCRILAAGRKGVTNQRLGGRAPSEGARSYPHLKARRQREPSPPRGRGCLRQQAGEGDGSRCPLIRRP
jgi:hypothetical protein